MFLAVLSVAIMLSFHLNDQPTELERRMAKPLGAVFWAMAVMMLFLGLANYISMFGGGAFYMCCETLMSLETVNKYSRKAAIVQSGWRTQTVCCIASWRGCSEDIDLT